MAPGTVFGLLNIGNGILITAVSIPLILRKVKMNRLYGIRVEESFASEENWYAINAYGGKQLIIWSIPIMLAGIACFFIPFTEQNFHVMAFVMGAGPVVICLSIAIIRILSYAKRF